MVYSNIALGTASRTGQTLAGIMAWIVEFLVTNKRPILQVLLIPGLGFTLIFALIAVWFERKFLARAMLRVGPYYCGGRSGVLQLFADFIKLFLSEMILPDGVNRLLFALSPVMVTFVPALALVLIPFDVNWVMWDIGSLGLPMFLAIMGIAPLMPIFAGWVSNNKYSFIGAWRVAYMYISGEIPLVICAAAVAIMAGTFDLVGIVEAQKNMWFAIPQFIGFIIFFIGVLIESERTPFDIPVAETELVFGWRTEFSGILFGFTMMAEYVMLQAWAPLFVTLYLGGYSGPIIMGNVIGSHMFWLLAKFAVLVVFIILLRCIFPRPKMSQMLKIGWNYLTPIALLNLFIVLGLKMMGV
jgi:NADH-quinone oxidoreductase subunit H